MEKTVAYIAIRLTPKHIFQQAGQAKFCNEAIRRAGDNLVYAIEYGLMCQGMQVLQ